MACPAACPPPVPPSGSVVRTGQIWAGSPAKLLRTLTAEEAAFVSGSADNYAKLALAHKIEAEKVRGRGGGGYSRGGTCRTAPGYNAAIVAGVLVYNLFCLLLS